MCEWSAVRGRADNAPLLPPLRVQRQEQPRRRPVERHGGQGQRRNFYQGSNVARLYSILLSGLSEGPFYLGWQLASSLLGFNFFANCHNLYIILIIYEFCNKALHK